MSNAIDALEESFAKSKKLGSGGVENKKYNGRIRIRTDVSASGESVEIRIYDNGSGMTEEIRQRITEPFFTTKPVGKGTGIGLAISSQIVTEKHGGKMTCISAPERVRSSSLRFPYARAIKNFGHRDINKSLAQTTPNSEFR